MLSKNCKKTSCRQKPTAYLSSILQLFSLGSSYRTSVCTSAAVDALGSINRISITGRNCLNRTSVSASAASDTFFSIDLISHWSVPPYM